MVEDYFVFNGMSSDVFDIVLAEGLPPIHSPINELEIINIPGRDGFLTIDKGRRKPFEKAITCILIDGSKKQQVRRWLKGKGQLILSNDEDVFYKATIINPIEYEDHWTEGWEFIINFICQPFGYLLSGQNPITITTKGTRLINTNELAEPYIKIYGSGEVDLTINNNIHKFTITDYIEIDSELMECYRGSASQTFKGKFPVLVNGESVISWTGSVSKIEVIPRWRR